MVGNEFPVLTRQVIDPFVNGAQCTGAPFIVKVAAEALVPAGRSRPNEIREFLLLVFESCRHRGLLTPGVSRRWMFAAPCNLLA
jgi:hypothetical protein